MVFYLLLTILWADCIARLFSVAGLGPRRIHTTLLTCLGPCRWGLVSHPCGLFLSALLPPSSRLRWAVLHGVGTEGSHRPFKIKVQKSHHDRCCILLDSVGQSSHRVIRLEGREVDSTPRWEGPMGTLQKHKQCGSDCSAAFGNNPPRQPSQNHRCFNPGAQS